MVWCAKSGKDVNEGIQTRRSCHDVPGRHHLDFPRGDDGTSSSPWHGQLQCARAESCGIVEEGSRGSEVPVMWIVWGVT